jgi:hypothetical protein
MMKKQVVLFTVALLCSLAVKAQPVSATPDRKTILIGEKIKLYLKGFYPENQSPVWFSIDTIPHFEIMEKSKIDTQHYQQNIILTQTYILTSWDSGRWDLPAFHLPIGRTVPVAINVAYTPFDVSKPYNDIHDVRDVKATRASNWYWYFLGAILLIALLLLIFPPGKKEDKPTEVLDENAYKKAMKELVKIKKSNVAEENVKEYYTEIVKVFRWYVHARKGIQSFSKTTDDLAIQLQQLNIPQDQFKDLLQVLKLSDLVKYAKYQPANRDNDLAFEEIAESITMIEEKRHVV